MKVKLHIGLKTYSVDNSIGVMDTVPFLKDKRTFVPIRFIAETFGYDVDWNEKTKEVTISNDRNRVFDSVDSAALDWAMCYNNMSIGLHKALCSSIYIADGGYSYTKPYVGGSNSGSIPLPDGGTKCIIAIIHSHASTGRGTQKADKFSTSDVDAAVTYKCPNYVATPCGTLLKTKPKAVGGDGKTYLVNDMIPFDRKARLLLEGSWGYPNVKFAVDNFQKYHGIYRRVNTTADYYNFLFAEGVDFPCLAD